MFELLSIIFRVDSHQAALWAAVCDRLQLLVTVDFHPTRFHAQNGTENSLSWMPHR